MRNYLLLIALFFSMCKNNSNKSTPEQQFAGIFYGTQEGYPTTADINSIGNELTGTVTMNGLSAKLSGTANGTLCSGFIKDEADGKQYPYTGSITGDLLKLSVSSPDNNSQQVEMVMNRKNSESHNPAPAPVPEQNTSLNPGLFGEWVHTEILGAGTEFSMTNESLIEFLEDGTFFTWLGRSIASGYSRDEDKANASKGKWYTDGNLLHLIDTENDVAVNYTLDANRFLMNLTSGKKLYKRRR